MKYKPSFLGWFGTIGLDATYEAIESIALKLVVYYNKKSTPGQKLVVSYDPRYFAKRFAESFAILMAESGIKVFFSNQPSPSSVSVVASKHKKSMGTVVFTGDEHDASFIGIRAYDENGYFLRDEELKTVTDKNRKGNPLFYQKEQFRKWVNKGYIEPFDPSIPYTAYIHSTIDFSSITPSSYRVVYSPLYGSGRYYFDWILTKKGLSGYTVHYESLTDFNETIPSPQRFVDELYDHMNYHGTESGFIVSPDCTSFLFLHGPKSLSSQEICYLLTLHLVSKEKKGTVYIDKQFQLERKPFEDLGVSLCVFDSASFESQLKQDDVLLLLDEFGRIYFNDHGAPDALLCGYYLLEMFNQPELTPVKIEQKLKEVRELML
jgi:phosphomannomutase